MEEAILCACGCGEVVPASTSSMPRKYVNDSHRWRANKRKQAGKSLDGSDLKDPPISDMSDVPVAPPGEEPLTLDAAVARAEVKDIERANAAEARKLLAAESRMRRYEAVLTDCLTSYEPTPLVRPFDHGSASSEIEWSVVLSDWHVGQQTTLEQTGGIYQQDVATTRKQVAKLWRALSLLHEIESKTYSLPVLHILGLGDFIENDDMRPSQHREIESVMTVQVVQAFDLLVWFIRQAMTIFPRVELDMIGGNHDRTGRNRGNAGLGELDYTDTMAYLLGAFIERVLADDIASGRLKLTNWTTFFGYKEIAGAKVVFEHGSSMKWGGGYGGVPWYSVTQAGPKYAQMLGGADIVAFGHGHQPAVVPGAAGGQWIVSNGSLPGSSTYVQAGFKKVTRPIQWLLQHHADLGLVGWKPLYADVKEQHIVRSVWDDVEAYTALASNKTPILTDPEAEEA